MLDEPEIMAREMTHSDIDSVLDIEKRSFAAPWSRDMFARELDNRAARCFVFTENDRITGYICFWEVLDEAHIQTIAVHPERRGKGMGKVIMTHLESTCLHDGIRRIILEVGRKNEVARHLYKKCGFNSIGFRKQYYQETNDDALVMEKWLSKDRN